MLRNILIACAVGAFVMTVAWMCSERVTAPEPKAPVVVISQAPNPNAPQCPGTSDDPPICRVLPPAPVVVEPSTALVPPPKPKPHHKPRAHRHRDFCLP